MSTPQSLGGQVMARRQRSAAVTAYYAAPNHCHYCDKVIDVGPNERVPDVKRKKFCNKECFSNYRKEKV